MIPPQNSNESRSQKRERRIQQKEDEIKKISRFFIEELPVKLFHTYTSDNARQIYCTYPWNDNITIVNKIRVPPVLKPNKIYGLLIGQKSISVDITSITSKNGIYFKARLDCKVYIKREKAYIVDFHRDREQATKNLWNAIEGVFRIVCSTKEYEDIRIMESIENEMQKCLSDEKYGGSLPFKIVSINLGHIEPVDEKVREREAEIREAKHKVAKEEAEQNLQRIQDNTKKAERADEIAKQRHEMEIWKIGEDKRKYEAEVEAKILEIKHKHELDMVKAQSEAAREKLKIQKDEQTANLRGATSAFKQMAPGSNVNITHDVTPPYSPYSPQPSEDRTMNDNDISSEQSNSHRDEE